MSTMTSSAFFTAQLNQDDVASALNAMREELIMRFQSNEEEHAKLRSSIEASRSVLNDLGTRISTVQLGLSATADQARAVLATNDD